MPKLVLFFFFFLLILYYSSFLIIHKILNIYNSFEYNLLGDYKMKDKFNKVLQLVFPYKKVNFFVILLFLLGIILGAVFSTMINLNDQKLVIDKVLLFISNIDNDLINSIVSFKNSLAINFTYLFLILFLGITLIGVIFCALLVFLKGFTVGFTLASFVVSYSYKGLILSSLYLIFGQLLNVFVICVAAIYGIVFGYKILLVIFKNKNIELRHFFKIYLFISIILIFITLLSSFSECFLFPLFVEFFLDLYV